MSHFLFVPIPLNRTVGLFPHSLRTYLLFPTHRAQSDIRCTDGADYRAVDVVLKMRGSEVR